MPARGLPPSRFSAHARAPCPDPVPGRRPRRDPRPHRRSARRAASSRWARSAASSKPRSPRATAREHAVAVSSGTERARDHPARARRRGPRGRSSPPTRSSRPPRPRCTPARACASSTAIPRRWRSTSPTSRVHRPRHRGRRRGAHRRARSAPRIPGSPQLCHGRGRAPRRGRRPRARQRARRPVRPGTFGVAGAFSFYPTKVIAGGEGGMIVTDDDDDRRRRAHLPRPGQGLVPRQLPHAAGRELAHERAARRDRAVAARPARRVHRSAARRSPSATTPRSTTSASRPLAIPADAHCNYYKYIAFLPDGIDRTLLKQHAARASSTSVCRARSTTRRCTSSRCSTQLADRALPGRGVVCAPGTSACRCTRARRERRRLRRRVARDRARSRRSREVECASRGLTHDATDVEHTMSDEIVAVTGGSGFVGSHVVDALLGAGYDGAGHRPAAAAAAETSSGPRSTCSTRTPLTDALKGAAPVFHLAAMADVNDVIADPAESVARQRARHRARARGRRAVPTPAA